MKIAICINGLLRQPEESFDLINKSFVKPLAADVFIYSWNTSSNNKFLNNNRQKCFHTNEQLLQYAKDYFEDNLKNIIIEDYDTKIDEMKKELNINNLISPPYRFFPQCYKLCMSNQLRKQYQETYNFIYDIVIFIRTELLYYMPIQEEVIKQVKNGLFCFCAASDYGGLQTTLGVMNNDNANKYCSMYENYKKIYLKNQFKFFTNPNNNITVSSFNKYKCPLLYKNNIKALNSEYLYGYHFKYMKFDLFYRFPYNCGRNLSDINFEDKKSVFDAITPIEYFIDPKINYICKLGELPFGAINLYSLIKNITPHKYRGKLLFWHNNHKLNNRQLLNKIIEKSPYSTTIKKTIILDVIRPLKNNIKIKTYYYHF